MSLSTDIAAVYAEHDQKLSDLNAQVGQLTTVVSALNVQRDQLSATIAALEEENAALKEQLAEETPPPPPVVQVTTVFGANIEGKSASGQQTMVTKWGKDSAGRQFLSAISDVAPRSEDLACLHVSWKPGSVAVITDSVVRASCANLKAGDIVEAWHEADAKVNSGALTFNDAVARKNAFYDAVKRVRPDLLVANTLTGWAADPKSGTTHGNIDQWAQVKADLLGIDCDGIHGWPYPNYDDEINTAKAFLAKFPAYKGWCVPEFGTSRNATNDSDGSARAAWATSYANKFRNAKAAYVCLYEYESTAGNTFSTNAELTAWRALI